MSRSLAPTIRDLAITRDTLWGIDPKKAHHYTTMSGPRKFDLRGMPKLRLEILIGLYAMENCGGIIRHMWHKANGYKSDKEMQ